MRVISRVLAAAVLAVGLYGAASAGAQYEQYERNFVPVGEPAPDFELQVVGGEKVKLSDLTTKDDKVVLVNFWFLG